ncbi:MAG: hypothetical protein ABIH19_02205 [Candidatus Omnitrophota bacterium]
MKQVKAKIIANTRLTAKYFRLIFRDSEIAKAVKPGQFLQVKVADVCQPLLRRPFGAHQVKGADVVILYEVLGDGTKILSERKAGEYLDIIGPLGNGFSVINSKPAIIVAGGMGVAPLLFLAERIRRCQSVRVSKCQNLVLIGTREKQEILCEKEFKQLGYEVKVSTDDGSMGHKGKVTELLKRILLTTYDYLCLRPPFNVKRGR